MKEIIYKIDSEIISIGAIEPRIDSNFNSNKADLDKFRNDFSVELNEPIFQKAFETSKLSNLSPEQRSIYDENLIQYWGMKSALETAVEEREIEIAKNAILENADNKFIAKITGLTVEEVEKLRAEMNK